MSPEEGVFQLRSRLLETSDKSEAEVIKQNIFAMVQSHPEFFRVPAKSSTIWISGDSGNEIPTDCLLQFASFLAAHSGDKKLPDWEGTIYTDTPSTVHQALKKLTPEILTSYVSLEEHLQGAGISKDKWSQTIAALQKIQIKDVYSLFNDKEKWQDFTKKEVDAVEFAVRRNAHGAYHNRWASKDAAAWAILHAEGENGGIVTDFDLCQKFGNDGKRIDSPEGLYAPFGCLFLPMDSALIASSGSSLGRKHFTEAMKRIALMNNPAADCRMGDPAEFKKASERDGTRRAWSNKISVAQSNIIRPITSSENHAAVSKLGKDLLWSFPTRERAGILRHQKYNDEDPLLGWDLTRSLMSPRKLASDRLSYGLVHDLKTFGAPLYDKNWSAINHALRDLTEFKKEQVPWLPMTSGVYVVPPRDRRSTMPGPGIPNNKQMGTVTDSWGKVGDELPLSGGLAVNTGNSNSAPKKRAIDREDLPSSSTRLPQVESGHERRERGGWVRGAKKLISKISCCR